jgi:hypothetical protein
MRTVPYTGSPLPYDVVAAQCDGSITVTRFLQALPEFFCCGEGVEMPDIGREDLDVEMGEKLAVGNLLVAIPLCETDGPVACPMACRSA